MQSNNIHHLINEYVKLWEHRCYKNGIPDECHSDIERNKLAPSYRRICLAILKNDFILKSLDYTPRHSKYYDILKRIELSQRNKPTQLKLFL
jgi:predicted phosphoadenosine phosphosulfate sulfurtransferase